MTGRTRSAVDVSILSSGHDVADARLHRHCAALRRAGLTVEVIARGAATDAPDGTLFRRRRPRGMAARGVQALLLPAFARGRVIVTLDPDLVLAARLRRVLSHRRRLAVDLHEDYLALLRDRAWARGAAGVVARAWVRASIALSRHADLTVVADEHVPPDAAHSRLVVRNLPDLSMLPAASAPGPRPRAIYVGDVRRSRGLFTMLRLAELAPDWVFDIVGPVSPGDRGELDQWLATSPAAPRVRLHGRQPPAAAWRLAEGAWLGLSLLQDTPAFQAAIPSKLYEYLACGLPVLTSPLRRSYELVRHSGAGTVAADAEAAANLLNAWSSSGGWELAAYRAAASNWADRARDAREGNPYDNFAASVTALVSQTRQRGAAVPADGVRRDEIPA
jgi:glycosyltransferase involved in cell wall biosynthesis